MASKMCTVSRYGQGGTQHGRERFIIGSASGGTAKPESVSSLSGVELLGIRDYLVIFGHDHDIDMGSRGKSYNILSGRAGVRLIYNHDVPSRPHFQRSNIQRRHYPALVQRASMKRGTSYKTIPRLLTPCRIIQT